MTRLIWLGIFLCGLSAPLAAQETIRPLHQLALPSLDEAAHPDVAQFMAAHWQDYFATDDPKAFKMQDVRCEQLDLNGDGIPELIVVIDRDGWQSEKGMPLSVARWENERWTAIGWGWSEDEATYTMSEVISGWRTLQTGQELLRWDGKAYRAEEWVQTIVQEN